ncbi:MAG: ABC transporter permease [Crocinitomicaceae bacterium]|nr:ABC transporter permease [Crocinitomicaceae bacterium]
MRNSWLVALRELKERMGSRSFVLMSFFGPIIILCLIYFLFAFGGEGKQHWNVLITDPSNLLDNKIMAQEDKSITYSFADQYIEMGEFRDAKKFQQYDALFEVNEKVLSNKTAFVFYRVKPSVRMQTRLQFHIERRIEEVMIEQFTDLSVKEFRKIKQPLNVAFRDVFDPLDEASDLRGWVGFFYGAIIFVFIFLFGMTILRSVSREKSNRIVEVLLASVHPNQLLTGKIVGIGIAAFFQFIIWMVVVGVGLYFMRELIFPDLLDASNMDIVQMTVEVKNQTRLDQLYAASEYNEFVNLVYERVQFGIMTAFFLVFFIVGYLFYGSFFAAVGATSGSESDGQQFVLPIIFLLCFSLYAGYFALQNPESSLTTFFHYLPFTSPVVVMVKLAQGYAPEESMQIYVALLILVVSAVLNLMIAGRLYKNGILQFGHRVKFRMLVRWLKKT